MADGLMTLEMHFPCNWSVEGKADVLYVDGSTGAERSYGTLEQGKYYSQETYPGHRWNLRESTSRNLLLSVVAQRPSEGPHVVTIGVGSGDPLRSAL